MKPGNGNTFEETNDEKFILEPYMDEELKVFLTNPRDKNFINKDEFLMETFESENGLMLTDAITAHDEEIGRDINIPVFITEDLLMGLKEIHRKEAKKSGSGKKKSKNDLSCPASKNVINYSIRSRRSSRISNMESKRVQPTNAREENEEDLKPTVAPVTDCISSSDESSGEISFLIVESWKVLRNLIAQYRLLNNLEYFHSVNKTMRPSKVKLFKCKFCKFSTYDISKIKNHKLSHLVLKPLPHDKSNFRDKSEMIHSPVLSVICTYPNCNYRTSKQSRLLRHVRIHTGEKPYSCPFCSYRCNQNGLLKIHIRRHTGVKPFECHLCSFKSVSQSYLSEHLVKHKKGGKFICSICKQIYFTEGNLLKHKKSHEE